MSESLNLTELPEATPVFWPHPAFPLGLIAIRHGQTVNAWHNQCPHQGRPLNYAPGKFLQTPDGQLMCAAHGATFETRHGECVAGPCKGASLHAAETIIDNETIRLAPGADNNNE